MSHEKIWRPIPDFEDYEVSEYGDVRKGNRNLKPERVQGSGRKRFSLSKGGQTFRFHAAHLVANAFLEPKPAPDAELCHNDGFEHNNHFTNLRWDNKLGNAADVAQHRLNRRALSSYPLSRRDVLSAEARRLVSSACPNP